MKSHTPPARFKHLLTPLQIGVREIRNRVLLSGHEIKMSHDGVPSAQYAAYHAARARGGVGLQITGITPFHRTAAPGMTGMIDNQDESVIPGYKNLARAVHAEGGTILAQLGHSAATANSLEPLAPAWAPSDVTSDLCNQVPHVMSVKEIHEIIDAHTSAAARVRLGDMDGVEILAAFGFLGAAFLSPMTNKRTDAYGGSERKRLRFLLEIAEASRGVLGADAILGVRMPGDEKVEGGLSAGAMQQVAKLLEDSGLVDYLNIAVGTNMHRIWRAEHWPPTPAGHGLYVGLASAIKSVVKLPVFAVGRVVNPDHAEDIIREGLADMVAMTRAHIADPLLVSKLWSDEVDDIRPCVGANFCIRSAMEGRAVSCIHNPETSRELQWSPGTPATKARQVVVIGAGPAGMEAARVCASRGHQVTLYEAADSLGGQLRDWCKVPSAAEYQKIIDWQSGQLQKYQVQVKLSHEVSSDDIKHLACDVVVLATGGIANLPAIEGSASGNVDIVSPTAVLADAATKGRRVVVWDHLGGGVGVGVSEWIAQYAQAVYLVTPHTAVAEDLDLTRRVPLYKRLMGAGVQFVANTQVAGIDANDVLLSNVYTQQSSRLESIDCLVPSHGARALDTLRGAIDATGVEHYVIGDALAPREMALAVAEAAIVARQI